MATHIMDISCGGTTYYISYSGEDIYRASTSGSRGSGDVWLSGLRFYDNAIIKKSTGEPATTVDICLEIAATLKSS